MNEMSDRRRRPKRKAAIAALAAMLPFSEDHRHSDSSPLFETHLPKELSVHILKFLSKPDLVHNASLASLAWCRATRNPELWESLEAQDWKKYPRPFPSMPQFYRFLRRPQFSKLKKLVPPDLYRTLHRNVFDKISSICSHLEDFDLSGSTSKRYLSLVPYDDELTRIPTLFPNLNKLRLCMRHVTRETLEEFTRIMGDRLCELSIRVIEGNGTELYDDTFQVTAENCRNLTVFRYDYWGQDSPEYGHLSERGPISLLQNCPGLKEMNVSLSEAAKDAVYQYAKNNGMAEYIRI